MTFAKDPPLPKVTCLGGLGLGLDMGGGGLSLASLPECLDH